MCTCHVPLFVSKSDRVGKIPSVSRCIYVYSILFFPISFMGYAHNALYIIDDDLKYIDEFVCVSPFTARPRADIRVSSSPLSHPLT